MLRSHSNSFPIEHANKSQTLVSNKARPLAANTTFSCHKVHAHVIIVMAIVGCGNYMHDVLRGFNTSTSIPLALLDDYKLLNKC